MKIIALVFAVAFMVGCAGNCKDGLRFNGIVLETGNCKMECSGGKPCNCSHDCPCWRTH